MRHYHPALHDIPVERRCRLLRGGSLKSRLYIRWHSMCVIFSITQRFKLDLRPSWMLRSVDWELPTFRDNLAVFEGQAVQEESITLLYYRIFSNLIRTRI